MRSVLFILPAMAGMASAAAIHPIAGVEPLIRGGGRQPHAPSPQSITPVNPRGISLPTLGPIPVLPIPGVPGQPTGEPATTTATSPATLTTVITSAGADISGDPFSNLDKRAGNTPGKVPVSFNGAVFVGTMGVGGSQVQAIMDTGSFDFWLINKKNDPAQCSLATKTGYGCYTATNSVLPTTYTIQGQYGDGSGFKGTQVAKDCVTGVGATAATWCNQMIDMVATYTPNLPQAAGIMGMGWNGLSNAYPVVNGRRQNALNELPLDTAGWTYYTTQFKPGTSMHVGFNYDAGLHQTSYVTIPVIKTNNAWWLVKPDNSWVASVVATTTTGGKVASVTASVALATSSNILLDTGTTLTYLDTNTVNKIYAALGGSCPSSTSSYCTYPCVGDAKTGIIRPTTGQSVTLPFGSGKISLDVTSLWTGYTPKGSCVNNQCPGTCAGTIQRSTFSGMSIYGTHVFLSAFFKWDKNAATVSMAQYK